MLRGPKLWPRFSPNKTWSGAIGGTGTFNKLGGTILGLTPKQRGTIEIFGADLDALDFAARKRVERRFGVMFQMGALFSGAVYYQQHFI